MPIYAYRCESCGHSQDVLQKISDPVLTVCPVCGKDTFRKQVTAAGFQLKGSGWYVTDFRNNSSGSPPSTAVSPSGAEGKPADAPAPAAAPAPAPASSSGSSGSGGSSSGGSAAA